MSSRRVVEVMIIGSLAVNLACGDRATVRDQPRAQETAKVVIDSLAIEFDPLVVSDWGFRFDQRLFTINVQRQILEPNRPLLDLVHLVDVRRDPDGYVVVFGPRLLGYSPLRYVLRCTKEEAEKLAATDANRFMDVFAIIADVTDLRKVEYGIVARALGEHVELELEVPDTFLVSGELRAYRLLRGGALVRLD